MLNVKLFIINGPNLNLLGRREPEVYGNTSFEAYLPQLKRLFPETTIDFYQSNIEGELIDALQRADSGYEGVILNAGAYTHTSVGIGDAVKAIRTPVVEVHLSNTLAREAYRHISYIAPHAEGVILGFGLRSYELAVYHFVSKNTSAGK